MAMILGFIVTLVAWEQVCCGSLYPRESETREVKILDGIWNFRTSQQDQEIGFRDKWYNTSLSLTGDVIPMPVPSSFNDITQNKEIRDYIGWVWYDTEFFVPLSWNSQSRKVLLRFGGAHYNARIFLNGNAVMKHTGGHLPFSVDVTMFITYGEKNRLTVALNNTLSPTTVPQGSVVYEKDTNRYPSGYHVQKVNFDFFNYAGIHRSVVLYNIPSVYIDDLTIVTGISGSTGFINYVVYPVQDANHSSATCEVQLYDKERNSVAKANGCQGNITVKNANFWWPQTMHKDPGYLYMMKVQLKVGNATDTYYQSVGIRTVQIANSTFLINGKPFYFMGFGKHEDANIRGKGLDLPLIVKDFNLIKWIGANAFRTSHYPYSEEMMDQADAQGIIVIDECPAVGLNQFKADILQQHLAEITELIQRDKNRPSVVMWSVANEPTSGAAASEKYFSVITSHARTLDPSRPITAALSVDYAEDKIGQFMDVIMVNRYYGWYSDTGHTEVIVLQLLHDITNFHLKYKKPVMISEYGSDTISGLHMDPSFIFTEDFQTEFIVEYHKAFDILRQKGFFVGELIWNFADFLTDQSITRVVGNKKGIFTRERQPKAAAKILRCRYHHLANNTLKDSTYCPAYLINSCYRN